MLWSFILNPWSNSLVLDITEKKKLIFQCGLSVGCILLHWKRGQWWLCLLCNPHRFPITPIKVFCDRDSHKKQIVSISFFIMKGTNMLQKTVMCVYMLYPTNTHHTHKLLGRLSSAETLECKAHLWTIPKSVFDSEIIYFPKAMTNFKTEAQIFPRSPHGFQKKFSNARPV